MQRSGGKQGLSLSSIAEFGRKLQTAWCFKLRQVTKKQSVQSLTTSELTSKMFLRETSIHQLRRATQVPWVIRRWGSTTLSIWTEACSVVQWCWSPPTELLCKDNIRKTCRKQAVLTWPLTPRVCTWRRVQVEATTKGFPWSTKEVQPTILGCRTSQLMSQTACLPHQRRRLTAAPTWTLKSLQPKSTWQWSEAQDLFEIKSAPQPSKRHVLQRMLFQETTLTLKIHFHPDSNLQGSLTQPWEGDLHQSSTLSIPQR